MYFAFLMGNNQKLEATSLTAFIRNGKSASQPQGIPNFHDHYSAFCLANGFLGKTVTCYHDNMCQLATPMIIITSWAEVFHVLLFLD